MVIITESPLQPFVTNCTFTAICDASRLTMQIKICYRIKICDSFSDRAMQNATTPFLILERRAIIEINIRDTQMTICTPLNWFACLLACFIHSQLVQLHFPSQHALHTFLVIIWTSLPQFYRRWFNHFIIMNGRVYSNSINIGIIRQSKSIALCSNRFFS